MRRFAVVAYAILFSVVLPLLLMAWSARLDSLIALPVPGSRSIGIALASLGALIIALSIADLRRFGRGWPMSPFPPAQRASRGMYGLMSDPIYVGSVILCGGAAVAFRSGAGVFITTPFLAMLCLAFVIGHERTATLERFVAPARPPFLHLPARSDEAPELSDRLSIYLLVLLPWWIAFEGVNALGASDAHSGWMAIDRAIPVIPWTEFVYFFDYLFVLAVPLFVRTRRQLREFAIEGWIATFCATLIYLTIPIIIIPKPASTPLMLWERGFADVLTPFPSFHVIWAIIAAAAFRRRAWMIVACAIAVSCVTTGMHAIIDIVAGAILGIAVIRYKSIAHLALRTTERLANSWREWDAGIVRLMSHGVYAAAGAFFGVLIAASLAGGMSAAVIAVGIGTIAGAALWAQWLEGSSSLLRPYGYYGGLIGACAIIALTRDPWRMLAAYAVASTVVSAFGRCRCLVQGCCHGRVAENGIRYHHARSRVTRLSAIAEHPLHATQLYSIVSNLVIFALLARLWIAHAPLQFIAGAAFVLIGLARFVEEHFRGEPQTRIVAGMRIYQWLALASVIAGAAMMAAGSTPAPAIAALDWRAWSIAGVVGLFTYIAYGVDFPRLNARFARLV